MTGFVIRYNRRTGDHAYEQFPNLELAMRERIRLDRERTNPDIENVVLAARDLEEIKATHSRYFQRGRDLAV